MTSISRRSLLSGAAGVAVLTACRADRVTPPAPDADTVARQAAAAAEQSLVDAYATAIADDPTQQPVLEPLREHHLAHIRALIGPPPTTTPTPSGALSSAASPTLAQLAASERALSARHLAGLSTAAPALALLLASVAAGAASYAAVLEHR